MTLQAPIPIFRIFDYDLAKSFYVEWLGFSIDWEHRFSPSAPRYIQVSRGPVTLHLSEHHGDCSPAARIFISVDDVEELHREISNRPNPFQNPGIEVAPWQAKVMEITDPFGNRLSFNQMIPSE